MLRSETQGHENKPFPSFGSFPCFPLAGAKQPEGLAAAKIAKGLKV